MNKANSLYIALLAILCFVLPSCAPTIHYLGESYEPSSDIEVFYDAKDVKKEYKVIGKMTNEKVVAINILSFTQIIIQHPYAGNRTVRTMVS